MKPDYFIQQRGFKGKLSSVFVFSAVAVVAWLIYMLWQMAFPTWQLLPWLVRTTMTFAVDAAMVYASFRLLKQNNLPAEALGLSVSRKTIADILGGVLIGLLSVVVIAGVLSIFIPYRLVAAPGHSPQVLMEGISYLAGNALEELVFRGFLFILLCRLAGWRVSALVMALPFGLFHLQGTGFGENGWKMFATTACFSFVFSLSYVLFRSMWASITVHAVSNLLLHAVTGLDGMGKALFTPVFGRSRFQGYDTGLMVMVVSSLIMAGALYGLIIFRSSYLRRRPIY